MWPLALFVASSTITVYADGRDPHALFSPKLLNRQLHLQLADPRESERLSHRLDSEWFSFAADFAAGTELPPGRLTRFHGFFVLDSYFELRPFDGVELNVNLVFLNVSASDGYRLSTYVLPGATAHLYADVFTIDGTPLSIDFIGPDLDLVTLGKGLLLEQIPLEGEQISLTYGDVELRHVFGGKVFWSDNLITLALDLFQGSAGLLYSLWFSDGALSSVVGAPVFLPYGERESYFAHHLGVYGSLELLRDVTFTGEYSMRLSLDAPKHGLLLRGDWSSELFETFQLHLGYQFRYYQRGFGPNVNLNETSTAPILPYREQIYATNSFEYFGVSKYYDQWSHSVMAELDFRAWENVGFVGAIEYFYRAVSDPEQPKHVIYDRRNGYLPNDRHLVYYRAGLEVYPWAEEKHHLSLLFTNKFVSLRQRPNDDSQELFLDVPLLLILAEVEL